MKPVHELMLMIREAGLIHDPYITATILNYEGGYIARNAFYASLTGESEQEQQLRDGHLGNLRVELSDLITQARILAAVYGWDWFDLIETGEAKLLERIETYKQRGVRPWDQLMRRLRGNYVPPPPPPPDRPVSPSFEGYASRALRRRPLDGD